VVEVVDLGEVRELFRRELDDVLVEAQVAGSGGERPQARRERLTVLRPDLAQEDRRPVAERRGAMLSSREDHSGVAVLRFVRGGCRHDRRSSRVLSRPSWDAGPDIRKTDRHRAA
jgi:hypothetical protein